MELLQKKAEPYVTEYGENQLPGAGQLLNSILRTGTEMVPGVGDLLGVEDLQTAAQNNDWGGIGLGALAAIPGIPAIGRGVRGEARAARGVANTVADAVPTNQPMTEAESALARYRAANPNDTGARVLSPGDEGYPTNAQWDELSQTYVAPVEPDYPIRAYHGSPHSFDRFSLDKIGTGEGAQAYGHGLYFAESEDVARSYRDALQQSALSLGGDVVANNPRIARLATAYPSADSAIQGVRGQLARAENALAASTDDLDRMIAEADINEARATLAELEPYAGQWFDKTPTGSMYEVGINADPNTFLDWDRPLSEQPEPVRRALGVGDRWDHDVEMARFEALAKERGVLVGELPEFAAAEERFLNRLGGDRFPDVPGSEIYRGSDIDMLHRTRDEFLRGEADQSQYLRERGISGIRYLDAGSRGAADVNDLRGTRSMWEGALRRSPDDAYARSMFEEADAALREAEAGLSSNYVVFNDDLVKILRKYGIGGLSTTVGASALAEELDRRGQTQEF
jgi:hypothetical protein